MSFPPVEFYLGVVRAAKVIFVGDPSCQTERQETAREIRFCYCAGDGVFSISTVRRRRDSKRQNELVDPK